MQMKFKWYLSKRKNLERILQKDLSEYHENRISNIYSYLKSLGRRVYERNETLALVVKEGCFPISDVSPLDCFGFTVRDTIDVLRYYGFYSKIEMDKFWQLAPTEKLYRILMVEKVKFLEKEFKRAMKETGVYRGDVLRMYLERSGSDDSFGRLRPRFVELFDIKRNYEDFHSPTSERKS